MAPWDYDWKAGPAGATLTDLDTLTTFVRVVAEWATPYRGDDPMAQYTHGEIVIPRKFHPAANFVLETGLDDTSAYADFSALKALLLGRQHALARIQRTNPTIGTVYLDCYLTGEAVSGGGSERFVVRWPMVAPRPFWVGTADTANSGATLTVAGDAPIDDMIINFTGGTDARLTHDTTGDYIQIDDGVPGGGVRVDVGAGTAVLITGGADHSNFLRVLNPWWFELDPGANPVTISGGGSYSADWLTKWR